ncbi:MAG: hypothetical protein F6K35_20340 [Okeania sp. SIO2H7]|nr:hypothetical protein [Okeania sp. SIO2H7]
MLVAPGKFWGRSLFGRIFLLLVSPWLVFLNVVAIALFKSGMGQVNVPSDANNYNCIIIRQTRKRVFEEEASQILLLLY